MFPLCFTLIEVKPLQFPTPIKITLHLGNYYDNNPLKLGEEKLFNI